MSLFEMVLKAIFFWKAFANQAAHVLVGERAYAADVGAKQGHGPAWGDSREAPCCGAHRVVTLTACRILAVRHVVATIANLLSVQLKKRRTVQNDVLTAI